MVGAMRMDVLVKIVKSVGDGAPYVQTIHKNVLWAIKSWIPPRSLII